jgi:hypothetical protein
VAAGSNKDQSELGKPRKPSPSEYGINDSDVDKKPNIFFDLTGGESVGLFLVVTAFFVFFLMDRHLTVVLSVIAGLVVTSIVFAILEGIEKKFRLARNPILERAAQYHNALKIYDDNQRRYERSLEQQREEYWRGLSGVQFEA